MKPPLTEAQKEKFQSELNKIFSEAPEEVQNLWTNQIGWIGDNPQFGDNANRKLKGKLADRFVILLNKLNDRRL